MVVLVYDLWLKEENAFCVSHKKVIGNPCLPLFREVLQLVNASARCDLFYHQPWLKLGLACPLEKTLFPTINQDIFIFVSDWQ